MNLPKTVARRRNRFKRGAANSGVRQRPVAAAATPAGTSAAGAPGEWDNVTRIMPQAAPPQCILIADDLTGACDSAVHFAAGGLRTFVPLAPDAAPGGAQVLAFSTESRGLTPADAACRIRQLAGWLRACQPRILFKKIDSVLRGNSGFEIVAALDAFACDAAVVNPAFPAMGRTVRAGALHSDRDAGFEPIELAGWLRARGAEPCAHVAAGSLASAIEAGARFISLDAVCAEDLAALAAEVLALRRRILWAGSAGLAGALARQLAPGSSPPESGLRHGPVLFSIGSDHPVTLEQQRRLAEERGLAAFPITAGSSLDALRQRVAEQRPAALFVSGGDTASLVCAAMGARSIELRREFAPGIPLGILHGGGADGLPILTKSGGFGAPDDLIRIADYFHA